MYTTLKVVGCHMGYVTHNECQGLAALSQCPRVVWVEIVVEDDAVLVDWVRGEAGHAVGVVFIPGLGVGGDRGGVSV